MLKGFLYLYTTIDIKEQFLTGEINLYTTSPTNEVIAFTSGKSVGCFFVFISGLNYIA